MRIALIVAGVVVFLAVSAGVARVLGATGAERAAVTDVVRAVARGDAAEVIGQIDGCAASPRCRARIERLVARLRRPGEVNVLNVEPSSRFALGSSSTTVRIAWKAGSALPVVQCVRVRREGSVLEGFDVRVLEVGPRIGLEADCG